MCPSLDESETKTFLDIKNQSGLFMQMILIIQTLFIRIYLTTQTPCLVGLNRCTEASSGIYCIWAKFLFDSQ